MTGVQTCALPIYIANSAYASVNSNWSVLNTVYTVANSAYANSNTKVTTGKSIAMAIVFS